MLRCNVLLNMEHCMNKNYKIKAYYYDKKVLKYSTPILYKKAQYYYTCKIKHLKNSCGKCNCTRKSYSEQSFNDKLVFAR